MSNFDEFGPDRELKGFPRIGQFSENRDAFDFGSWATYLPGNRLSNALLSTH